jgi:hypothetical protein
MILDLVIRLLFLTGFVGFAGIAIYSIIGFWHMGMGSGFFMPSNLKLRERLNLIPKPIRRLGIVSGWLFGVSFGLLFALAALLRN